MEMTPSYSHYTKKLKLLMKKIYEKFKKKNGLIIYFP